MEKPTRARRPVSRLADVISRVRIPTASGLDFKLGLRMLARHPSLTVVAVLAMAFGIAAGAGGFHLLKEMALPPLPYLQNDRIVAIQNVSTATTRPNPRMLRDFESWRRELRSIERVSALSLRDRNLVVGERSAAPVVEAAVSASAFDLLKVAPLMGRRLVPTDESPGAPPVAVIGYDVWQKRFAGAPDVVGRVMRLGGEPTTVVGVMPEGFAFFVPREETTLPRAQDLWVPFRLQGRDLARGEGPAIAVFGRLASGATPERAAAEVATFAARANASAPGSGELKSWLLTFEGPVGKSAFVDSAGVVSLSTVFLAALMAVVCGNVALLFFARAATREGEIAVRSALGASRGRIVAQLFAEALVLAVLAALVGLIGASVGIRWVVGVLRSMLEVQGLVLPSWIGETLSPATVAYAVALAVVGAVVVGVLPGVKVTSGQTNLTLQRLANRGTGVRLGGIWTAIVVVQVTLTVMFVPIAVLFGLQTWRMRTVDLNLPAAEHLSVRLERTGGTSDAAADEALIRRYEQGVRALERRVLAEPGVTGATIAAEIPGSYHDLERFQLDATVSDWERRAQIASVDPNYFDVLRTPVLAGRGFTAADVGAAQRLVVVNESFVREFLNGRNAIGHRVRFRDRNGRDGVGEWNEIVGVVRDLAMTIDPTMSSNAGIYHPLQPGTASTLHMIVRVAREPQTFVGRLHEIAADAAPELQLRRALPLDQAAQSMLISYDGWFRAIVIGGLMAILLTNAGIYAVIAYTVARRTREIGIRVALGADRRQVIAVVLSRTLRHVTSGVVVGGALGSALTIGIAEGSLRPTIAQGGALLLAYLTGMLIVCLLASVVPTRRALAIEPTEALAADG